MVTRRTSFMSRVFEFVTSDGGRPSGSELANNSECLAMMAESNATPTGDGLSLECFQRNRPFGWEMYQSEPQGVPNEWVF